MKRLILIILLIQVLIKICIAQTTGYPYVIQNINWTNQNQTVQFIGDIISPGNSSEPVSITGSSNVQFLAGHQIALKPGFDAKATNPNFNFLAKIAPPIQCVLITPDPSTSIDANGIVHVNEWEKLEIGMTMPTNIQTAVDNYLAHYHTTGPNLSQDISPFADDSLQVVIHLTSPSGQQYTKFAFYMVESMWDDATGTAANNYEDDQLNANVNSPYYKYFWRFRFAPDEVNSSLPWTYNISIYCPFRSDLTPSVTTYNFTGFSFFCDPPLPGNNGYLHVEPNYQRYLQFDNGNMFFGMGDNLWGPTHDNYPFTVNNCGSTGYSYFKIDYDDILNSLDSLNSVGANYVRMELGKQKYIPEWDDLGYYYDVPVNIYPCQNLPNNANPGGIGDLSKNKQFGAWTFDKVLERLRADNIYLKLNIMPGIGGAYQTFWWGDNAYVTNYAYSSYTIAQNVSNIFETSPSWLNNHPSTQGAIYYWKRLYKYILSRWGYSTNLAVIEPFSEIDGTFGYNGQPYNSLGGEAMCESSNSDHYTITPDPNLQSSIEYWHQTMLPYIKDPINGLGDKHLYTISYQVYDNASYNSIYSDPNIDIIDVHNYNDEINANLYRFTQAQQMSNDFPGKPIHYGECSTFGTTSSGNDTKSYYNNYDVSMHNEIWSTTMSGLMACGHSWFWNVIHRWPYSNAINGCPSWQCHSNCSDCYCGESNCSSCFYLNSGETISGLEVRNLQNNGNYILPDFQIKSMYHNYLPLSNFISNVNLYDNYTPFTFQSPDTFNNPTEAYYLVGTDQSFGWVHNIHNYWGNSYVVATGIENYYGCQRLPSPSTALILDGFITNVNYSIVFYPTRMGAYNLPVQQFLTCTNGQLTIDLSSAPLGCDSTNSDYAFIIYREIIFPHRDLYSSVNLDFQIYPNPTTGIVNISIPKTNDGNGELIVSDFTERIIYNSKGLNNQVLALDFSDKSKGVYFVQLKNNFGVKVKRLIIE